MFSHQKKKLIIKNNTNDLLHTSVTRSGLRRIATTDMATQIEYQYLDKPLIRLIHNCSSELSIPH